MSNERCNACLHDGSCKELTPEKCFGFSPARLEKVMSAEYEPFGGVTVAMARHGLMPAKELS